MKMKLPFKFMVAMLVIAVAWFVIMILYLDDLTEGKSRSRFSLLDKLKHESPETPWLHRDGQFQFFIKNKPLPEDTYKGGAEYIDDKDVAKYVFGEEDNDGKYVSAPKFGRVVPIAERVVHKIHTKKLTANELLQRINVQTGVYNGTRWKGEGRVIAIEKGQPVKKNHSLRLIQTITVPEMAMVQRPAEKKGNQYRPYNSNYNRMVMKMSQHQNKLGRETADIGYHKDNVEFWGQQLDAVNHRSFADGKVNNPIADDAFRLDRKSILQQVDHKAKEIEQRTFNISQKDNVYRQVVNVNSTMPYGSRDHVLPLPYTNSHSVLKQSNIVPNIERHKTDTKSHQQTLIQRQKLSSKVKPTSARLVNTAVPAQNQLIKQEVSLDRQRDLKHSFDRHSFNVSASDTLPLNRHVPDTRPEA